MKKKQHSHEIIHHPTTKKLNTQEEKKDFKHIFFRNTKKKNTGKKNLTKTREKKRKKYIPTMKLRTQTHTHMANEMRVNQVKQKKLNHEK